MKAKEEEAPIPELLRHTPDDLRNQNVENFVQNKKESQISGNEDSLSKPHDESSLPTQFMSDDKEEKKEEGGVVKDSESNWDDIELLK